MADTIRNLSAKHAVQVNQNADAAAFLPQVSASGNIIADKEILLNLMLAFPYHKQDMLEHTDLELFLVLKKCFRKLLYLTYQRFCFSLRSNKTGLGQLQSFHPNQAS